MLLVARSRSRLRFVLIAVACVVGFRPWPLAAVPPSMPDEEVRSLTAVPSDPSALSELALARVSFDSSAVNLLTQVTSSQLQSNANDVWGYVSPSGREYAIVGLVVGTAFVEVTEPTDPTIVAIIPDASSTWSDMAVYQEYAYNVNENGSAGGMQVIDLTQIDSGTVTLLDTFSQNGLDSAHNVFVNTDSGYLYLCGADAPTFGLVAVDVSDPTSPNMVGIWTEAYVHDVYVTNYADCPYSGRSGPCEIAFAFAGGAGFKIIDVTDKSSMTTIATLQYPNRSYCHQGWPTQDKRYMLIDDELDELNDPDVSNTTTYVVNIEDLADPQFVTSFSNGNTSIDHNLMTRGDYVFEANYTSGLRIYDISDLNSVTEVGYFDTFPSNDNAQFNGAWGVYSGLPSGIVLISDMSGGLFVLDAFDAVGCQQDSHCNDGNSCTADTCNPDATCSHASMPEGTACEDGDVCTIDGQCDNAGNCISTDINTLSCSDDGPCSPGFCDTDAGLCVCFPCHGVTQPGQGPGVTVSNRFLSITPGNPGELTALRVTFTDLPSQFSSFVGKTMWIGEPTPVCENAGQGAEVAPENCGPAPGLDSPTFLAAPLVCAPTFRDWSLDGTVHAYGDPVVPGGKYSVQATAIGCYFADIASYSPALAISNADWGDVVQNCSGCPCSPPEGDVGLQDVFALLRKFASTPCSITKVRGELRGSGSPDLDFRINLSDVLAVLAGFSNTPYPYGATYDCP